MYRPKPDEDFWGNEHKVVRYENKPFGMRLAKIFVLSFFIGIIWLFVSSYKEVKSEDAKKPRSTYYALVVSSFPLDPATLRVKINVVNVGEVSASAECSIDLYNNSRVYKGSDSFRTTELAPQQEGNFIRDVIIAKEGAAFVTNSNISCK